MSRSRMYLFAVLPAALLLFLAARNLSSQPAAKMVGNQACLECHDKQGSKYLASGHGRAGQDSAAIGRTLNCETCHGPGSLHVEGYQATGDSQKEKSVGEMADLRKVPAKVVNELCTSCHKSGEQFYWESTEHARNDVSCVTCHSMHDAKDPGHVNMLRAENSSATCLTCHKSKKFRLSRSAHMPIGEGQMNCASCHNPHGSAAPHQLRAGTVNELCESCHADKRGPMLWEHAPVRENCLNCHEPHGGNNDKVLVGKKPFLCQRCHVGTRHPSTLYDGKNLATNRLVDRACTNCHSQVHGSNHPSGKFFLR